MGSDNTYTLYEDDGLTTAYERGAFAETPLRYGRTDSGVTVSIGPARGAYDGQPQCRAYRIELPGVPAGAAVRVNGRRAKAEAAAASRWRWRQRNEAAANFSDRRAPRLPGKS